MLVAVGEINRLLNRCIFYASLAMRFLSFTDAVIEKSCVMLTPVISGGVFDNMRLVAHGKKSRTNKVRREVVTQQVKLLIGAGRLLFCVTRTLNHTRR